MNVITQHVFSLDILAAVIPIAMIPSLARADVFCIHMNEFSILPLVCHHFVPYPYICTTINILSLYKKREKSISLSLCQSFTYERR